MDQTSTQHATLDVAETPTGDADRKAPYTLAEPVEQRMPVVFASPHSGRNYPAAFLAASRLDTVTIRRSEDSFVEEIFGAAPSHGAPLLMAEFPRAYVDPNREAFELDPAMFDGALPNYVNTNSPRVAAGLGTVAKVVTNGEEIYDRPITFDDAKARIDNCYRPYHEALQALLDRTLSHFGGCLLIDCHSMPSIGGPMDFDPGRRRVDFVLGDNHGLACNPSITELVDETLSGLGYVVHRNNPYSGGFTTRHYGRPVTGVHVLQIEINRATYMNEEAIERGAGFEDLVANMGHLIEALSKVDPASLKPR